ncbi:MAG: hypothetical protein ACI4JQ_09195, partial [Ruminococcus sp.]
EPVVDFHHQVIAHAGHTTTKKSDAPGITLSANPCASAQVAPQRCPTLRHSQKHVHDTIAKCKFQAACWPPIMALTGRYCGPAGPAERLYALRQEILDYFLPTGVVPKLINLTSGPRREVALRNVMNGRGISICYESDISIYKINSLKVCSIKEFPSCALCLGVKKDHITTNHEQMLISTLISYSQNSICPTDF